MPSLQRVLMVIGDARRPNDSPHSALIVMFFDHLISGGGYAVAVPVGAMFTRYIFKSQDTAKRR